MISLIIPSYNNPEYLEFCLESAFNNQVEKNEIIVIVDGPGTFNNTIKYQDIGKKWKDSLGVHMIPFDSNFGLSFALNTGVQYANNQRILIINEDNVLPYKWDVICEMAFCEKTVTSFMQVEPQDSIFHFKRRNFGMSPTDFDMKKYIAWDADERSDVNISESINGCLFPFLISKDVYMMVGGFDTAYSSPFVVDLDFWYKLQLANVSFRTISDMNVYHFGSRSTKKKEGNTINWEQSEQYAMQQFFQKWGFYPVRDENYRIVSNDGMPMRGMPR